MGVANISEKLILFSDGLDVHLPNHKPNGEDIIAIHKHFKNKVETGFGFGTNLTNDFRGCSEVDPMLPLSLICKPVNANGNPCIKLSDNHSKMTVDAAARVYLDTFGNEGVTNQQVKV